MRKLYFHIGSHKTGTTSIQNALHLNREEIKEKGFVYPGSEMCHHLLYFITQQDEALWPRQFKGIEKKMLQEHVTKYLVEVAKDIMNGPDIALISSEYFFLSDSDAIEKSINWLKDYVDEIEVIVFIRDPIHHYSSSQQQVIKANHYLTSPERYHYNFREVIDRWSDFCKVNVINFEKGVDSLESFLSVIGLDNEEFKVPNRVNESLSLEQMMLLEKIQNNVYSNYPNMFKKHLSLIQGFKTGDTTKPQIKKDVSKVISNNHYEDSLWLRDEYGINFGYEKIKKTEHKVYPEKCGIDDVYETSGNKLFLYESLFMDALMKEVVKSKNKNK